MAGNDHNVFGSLNNFVDHKDGRSYTWFRQEATDACGAQCTHCGFAVVIANSILLGTSAEDAAEAIAYKLRQHRCGSDAARTVNFHTQEENLEDTMEEKVKQLLQERGHPLDKPDEIG